MATYNKNDPASIQNMFNSIANQYDKTNAVLSFQMHKRWNRQLVQQVLSKQNPHNFLDLCCGTGDIALNYLQKAPNSCQAYLVDFCSNMLTCAKDKMSKNGISNHQIQYVQADVQELPFSNESMDCATMAYGIRNVKDPSKCIREVYRVLKPGGCFGILELTQPKNNLLKMGHRFYLRSVLPVLGRWLTSNQDAYSYLQNSIQTFIAPAELEKIMHRSQFIETRSIPLLGGIATIIIGNKPKGS
ncbi:MAG: bifunctional demethylmenaquinone methyltransferase/2-methoxy-6-polyprenyl-1,4-benzoquinol methylase UbiE [Parachlamydiaceae bacterium]|nr:bifunctional demethylmenaquinone methyltransferase/2-methoxy-6-polyprenyl-1,4-benzoquinol methylase UbiE [Parachlamydiaceae bacterium]